MEELDLSPFAWSDRRVLVTGHTGFEGRSTQMSFFQPFVPTGYPARIATMRAGNVIGGDDWSHDPLVRDISIRSRSLLCEMPHRRSKDGVQSDVDGRIAELDSA